MKKILFGLMVATLALAFMGCPTTYGKDYAYASASAYYVGDSDGWVWEKMTYNEATGVCEIDVTVKAGQCFKITPAASWDQEWNYANLDDATLKQDFIDKVAEYGKYKVQITDAGTYHVVMDVSKEKITVTAK